MQPHEYTRRVLVISTGMSPQVVTETLYALINPGQGAASFLPTEVHLLTTQKGQNAAEKALFDNGRGWFHRFVKDYKCAGIGFDSNHIHVFRDAEGRLLEDIRTDADNTAAADAITNFMREITADEDCALHVSLAGGRKTLSFYMGYAASLYGRNQDRLSHVLVSEPFEQCPDFFYPPVTVRNFKTHDGKVVSSGKAVLTLAEIPFVCLRHGLSKSLQDGQNSFLEAVTRVQRNLGAPKLLIDLKKCQVTCGCEVISMKPVDLAFYSWMAEQVIQGKPPIHRPDIFNPGYATEFLRCYKAICGEMYDYSRVEKSFGCGTKSYGMGMNYFDNRKSDVHKALNLALDAAAEPYRIQRTGKQKPFVYGLALKPEQIEFV